MRDWIKTVISQYGNSPTLLAIIETFNESIRPDVDIDNFYNTVWNIDTAEGFGLDIWGRIVGLPTGRYIYTNPVTVLQDPQFKILILVKAFSNISVTSAPTFNQILQTLFPGRGRCYVNDQLNMQMRYTFEFQPEPWEIAVMGNPQIFLRPAGVQVGIFVISLPAFGFSEAGSSASPWNQAPFAPAEIIT